MQAFPRLKMQKSSCMLLARNIQNFKEWEYMIIIDVPSDTWWLDSGATIHV